MAAELDTEGRACQEAVSEGDVETAIVWAGEAIDLIAEVVNADGLARSIGMAAASNLRYVNRFQRSD